MKPVPHQRVFVVPGLFATSNASVPRETQDAELVEKWAGHAQPGAAVNLLTASLGTAAPVLCRGVCRTAEAFGLSTLTAPPPTRYMQWITTEPRIIGIFPWHFDSWAGENGLGADSFPKTLAAVAAFGKSLAPPTLAVVAAPTLKLPTVLSSNIVLPSIAANGTVSAMMKAHGVVMLKVSPSFGTLEATTDADRSRLALPRLKSDEAQGGTLADAFRLIKAQGRQIAELQTQLAMSSPPATTPGLFVVTEFGADPSGQRDSTQAIQQAFYAATDKMARDGIFGQGNVFEPEVISALDHFILWSTTLPPPFVA